MLTNSVAFAPLSIRAILPHGPLICEPDQMVVRRPLESNTKRQPLPLVAVVPSVLGGLPTITQPLLNMVIAVVRPMPPGHCGRACGSLANRVVDRVEGLKSMIVPPVPCRFEVLLKLSTRTSPFWILPDVTGGTTTA